jgi:hypothetical protein
VPRALICGRSLQIAGRGDKSILCLNFAQPKRSILLQRWRCSCKFKRLVPEIATDFVSATLLYFSFISTSTSLFPQHLCHIDQSDSGICAALTNQIPASVPHWPIRFRAISLRPDSADPASRLGCAGLECPSPARNPAPPHPDTCCGLPRTLSPLSLTFSERYGEVV